MAAVFDNLLFVFSLPDLVLTACLKKTESIGFLPDGRFLMRRKITRTKEGLFAADFTAGCANSPGPGGSGTPGKAEPEKTGTPGKAEPEKPGTPGTGAAESPGIPGTASGKGPGASAAGAAEADDSGSVGKRNTNKPITPDLPEPPMQEVFRFERVLESAYEYLCGGNIILLYVYKNGETFSLMPSETMVRGWAAQDVPALPSAGAAGLFVKRPLPGQIFGRLETILFFDVSKNLLCTRKMIVDVGEKDERVCFWEADSGRFLYSAKTSGKSQRSKQAVYDENTGAFLLWGGRWSHAVFQPMPLPVMPYRSVTAEWRLSHVVTARERLQQEDRLSVFRRQFEACRKKGDVAGMVGIHEKCLAIPGFPGSDSAWRMEDILEKTAARGAFHSLHYVQDPGDFSGEKTPDAGPALPETVVQYDALPAEDGRRRRPYPLCRDHALRFSAEETADGCFSEGPPHRRTDPCTGAISQGFRARIPEGRQYPGSSPAALQPPGRI